MPAETLKTRRDNMGQTKRELVEAALQGKPADRVPVGFWHHFLQDQRHADALSDPKAWEDNIQGHESFCRSWDPDFIKVMTDGFFLYPHPELHGLRSIRDASHIRPLGHSSPWIQKQIELCRILTDKYKDQKMVFYNLFSPARCIEFQQTGDDAKAAVVRFMKEDPEALKYVMDVLAEDVADLAQSVIQEGGADGVYLSVQNIPSPEMTEERYREFIAPSEIRVLKTANEASSHQILHICGYMGCHNDLSWYKDYPFEAVNWAVVFEGVPLEEGRRIFGGRTVIGGFDNTETGVLYRGSREEIEKETRRILADSGRDGVILGADCTVPKDIDPRHFEWVRETAAR
jgi:uroporphyrinogen decarboxylase